jgi:hypothetical protein|tara:strand:- start:725 stop:1366 length:642 start_codon:yes stop_codon:yes gene_type:complete
MSDFTDFFPAAGGGGGFTKRLKWTTARGLDDANYNNAASYTVNPATDLGLSDGDSLGFFMVSGGYFGEGSTSYMDGGMGGKIIQGTAIITTAATNLVLTPGIGGRLQRNNYSTTINTAPTESTISGGLTLTSGNGSNLAGARGEEGTYNFQLPNNGINGYGGGGGPGGAPNPPSAAVIGSTAHGFGFGTVGYNVNTGGVFEALGGDGAILLYY